MKTAKKIISYILVAAIAASFGALIAGYHTYRSLQSSAGAGKLSALEQLLQERFIGDVDSQALYDGAAAGMVAALNDPWSYYMSRETFLSYQQTMSNSFVGIGVSVSEAPDGSGYLVVRVIEGGSAWEQGIQAGDIFTHVGQTSLEGKPLDQLDGLFKGEEGTSIQVTLKKLDPSSRTLTVELDSALTQEEREKVADRLTLLDNVASVQAQEEGYVLSLTDPGSNAQTREAALALPGVQSVSQAVQPYSTQQLELVRRAIQEKVAWGQMLSGNVGLVTIANFNTRCSQETIAAIDSLVEQGATSLILDVRNNGGGYVVELVAILDHLLPEGDLFISEDYTGKREVETSDAKCLELPMVVMVNGNSYSAAEFFAAALREYEWAKVVGEKTTGKGYFQVAYQLPDGSAVNLSIGKYYTPKGVSLAQTGVTPDLIVEVDAQTQSAILNRTLDPEEDPQIQGAMQLLLGE